MSAETETTWIGWHRSDHRSPWRPIVQADSENAAFQQLLNAVRGGDKCVLPRGIDPNNKSARRRRRF